MKRLFLILSFVFMMFAAYGQTSKAKVTLKNGVVVTGILKEFVLNDHVTISISGLDSTISMNEIDSIENLEGAVSNANEPPSLLDQGKYGNYKITDNTPYPETIKLELDGQTFTLYLVKGGVFNMGYDDRHSLGMKSEPVHQVTLSSFYVSKESVSKQLAQKLLSPKSKNTPKDDNYYSTTDWDNADKIVKAIAEMTHKPYRMLTEAEWEYTSLMPIAKEIFGEQKYAEWCSDFFGAFDSTAQTNPTGPTNGKQHVTRSFNGRRNKWDRSFDPVKAFVRIAIDANMVK